MIFVPSIEFSEQFIFAFIKVFNLKPSAKIYLSLLAVFLISGILFLLSGDKGDLVIILSNFHSSELDRFFVFLTFLGDGIWFAPLILVLLFIRYSWSATFALLGLVQLLIVQGMKRMVFGSTPRPAEFFKGTYELPMVDGVDIHHFYSFPSGHTATAFGITFMLVLLLKPRKGVSMGLLLLAVLVGISRIYLGQHFLEDVLAGAVLGTFLSYLVYKLYEYMQSGNSNSAFFNSSLWSSIRGS